MVRKIVLLITFLLCSCVSINNKREQFKPNEISLVSGPKTDGFYYFERTINQEKWIHVILFFENGYFLNVGAIPSSNYLYGKQIDELCADLKLTNTLSSALANAKCVIENYDAFFNQGINFINRKSIIHNWGKYTVKDNEVFVRYYSNYLGNYYLTERSGKKDPNDHLTFNRVFFLKDGKENFVNEDYIFMEVELNPIEIPAIVKNTFK
ncbi:hypothetical protein [Gelidibacter salicanalis]|uniref:Lipoprotein n=1 Tax=Gelidibacter salicanalis TaxID=291193 RepID=A0A934NH56_9FLAO|nr:hypothetical protein [Gelidibacter salicanalis]MBJ7880426.1 hypothetical protein [Gelidibacter salicanalis]